MNRLTDSKWFNLLLALFFALLLFFNANSDNRAPKTAINEPSLSSTAENVLIKLDYDESKYYVSGYEEETTVSLQSSNKVLLDIETNPQTRNFSVVADLTKYKEGTYEIPLQIKNLNNAVQATLKNEVIHVTIEKRVTKKFNVEPRQNDSLLKKGYELNDIKIDPPQVEITSGENTIKSIQQVIAPIDDDRDIMENFSKRVEVIALDKSGNVANVICVPSTVTVAVHVEAPSKSVPVKVKQSGSIATGIKNFTFELQQENVKISGPREVLEEIEFVEVVVDTSIIQGTITNSYTIELPGDVVASPPTAEVKIIPHYVDKEKTKDSSKGKTEQDKSKETSVDSTKEENTTHTTK